ncbi:MAG TPA: hypothetical protein VD837_14050 [Terriglobales bacterium]|nr:hypothetical protein [Terriglobales bacterium]
MATNPHLPHDRDKRHDGRMTLVKEGTRGRNWWPIVILLVAAAVLAGVIAFAPFAPKERVAPTSADVPIQPTGGQVQVSDVNITKSPQDQAANLTGTLFNAGNTDINAIQGVANFKGNNGQNVASLTAPIMGMRENGGTQPLAENPLKPGERRAFQMRIDRVPEGWNGNLPELQFTTVTGQTPTRGNQSGGSEQEE